MPNCPSHYNRGNIYLSGGMQHAIKLGGAWRVDISNRLREMRYWPLDITHYDVSYAQNHGKLFDLNPHDHLPFKSDIRKHFIQTDLALIDNESDALIVFYDESARRGAGTISECQHAFTTGKPVFLVSDWPDIEAQVPGWLLGLTTKTFPTFDLALDYFDKLPHGILKKDLYGNHRAGNHYLCSLCGDTFEKRKHLFVSTVNPLYCSRCVDVVCHTREQLYDRYSFFQELLHAEIDKANEASARDNPAQLNLLFSEDKAP